MLVNVIASWSGGKDSCHALYLAMREGHNCLHLVNFISDEYQRVRFHGTEARMIEMQSRALGIPLAQKETTAEGYERQFKAAVRDLLPSGAQGMVFGDIYLEEHRQWVEGVCADLGITAIEPLWGTPQKDIITDFIGAGFEAIVVGAQRDKIDERWLGRPVDEEFVRYLEEAGVDVCGENGEFHTVVVDGPIFSQRIVITEARTIARNGFWFLDTQAYELQAKPSA